MRREWRPGCVRSAATALSASESVRALRSLDDLRCVATPQTASVPKSRKKTIASPSSRMMRERVSLNEVISIEERSVRASEAQSTAQDQAGNVFQDFGAASQDGIVQLTDRRESASQHFQLSWPPLARRLRRS